MTQDNIQQDTPQATTEEFTSLEEAVFGNEGSENTITSAFTSGETGSSERAPLYPERIEPQVSTQENVQPPAQPNNDETRYQYWQSQADRYKNELDTLKGQQQQPVQQQPAVQQPVQPAPVPVEQFPAAPNKPQRPRTYSREEAYSDPNSDSARYMDDLEGWRDDINEYNTLKSEYNTAIIEDKFNAMQKERVVAAKKQQASQLQAKQESEIKSHIMGHYSMQESEAVDFMSKMSDPKSITIDNLVQLYRLQGSGTAQQQQTETAPSDAFTQTRNAQQVPSPMGVMPSGHSNNDERTFEDKMMDKMIGNFDSKNPWK